MDTTIEKPSPSEKFLISGTRRYPWEEKARDTEHLTRQSPNTEASLSVQTFNSLHAHAGEVVSVTGDTGVISVFLESNLLYVISFGKDNFYTRVGRCRYTC